jgi:SSS family solute:Na+ symporter
MSRTAVVLGVALAYLGVSLFVGIVAGRKTGTSSAKGFVAADRSFGLLLMYFVTGATIFSSFAFLGMPGWAYEKGGAALYVLSYGGVAMVPLYFIGPRIAAWGRRFGYLTQADFVADRFGGSVIPGLMAWVSLLAFLPYLVLQMKGAGYILSAMTDGDVPEWLGALLPYLVVTLYVLFGGVRGVGATNVFQGIFMLVVAWTLGLIIPYKLYGGIGPMFERIIAERPGHLVLPGPTGRSVATYCSDVLVSTLGFTMWPHLFMKIFTSKSDRILRQTVVLYPTFLLFLVPILFLGFAGVLWREGVAPSDTILPLLVGESDFPLLVVGLFCAGGLAASMSSGDAIVHAASSVMIHDFVGRVRGGISERGEALLMKGLVVVLGGVAYAIALTTKMDLVKLLLMGYGGVVQFFPPILAGCYWRRATREGVLAGLVAGVAVTASLHPDYGFVPSPWGLHPGVPGVVVNATLLVLVSLLTRPPADAGRFFPGSGSSSPERAR